MPNSIAFAQNYTGILDEVHQRASVSGCLNSGRRLIRASQNAREIKIPMISVTGLGNYTRNVGYRDESITMTYETKSPNYDRGLRLLADVMDVEEGGILDAFVAAGAELQRTQVAPEADAFTFSQVVGFEGVATKSEDLSEASAEDILAALRAVTNEMDEKQVSTGSRYLFITPTLKGIVDDFSSANPNRSNRVLERFSRIVEVPQVRFYTAIDLLSGGDDGFGYRKAAGMLDCIWYGRADDAADMLECYQGKGMTKNGRLVEKVAKYLRNNADFIRANPPSLGTMEAENEHLYASRMKSVPCAWSAQGASDMARLRSRKFSGRELLCPTREESLSEEKKRLRQKRVEAHLSKRCPHPVKCIGHGYEYPHNASVANFRADIRYRAGLTADHKVREGIEEV